MPTKKSNNNPTDICILSESCLARRKAPARFFSVTLLHLLYSLLLHLISGSFSPNQKIPQHLCLVGSSGPKVYSIEDNALVEKLLLNEVSGLKPCYTQV